MKHFLYRVQLVEYPKGATEDHGYDYTVLDPEWTPEGWEADARYLETFGTSKFIWPSTNREYKSRSSAVLRKQLLESFGAKCIIQRSSQIVWPADGEEKVPTKKERARALIDGLIAEKPDGAA